MCRERGSVAYIASALDYVGAVTTLLAQMKRGRLPYLIHTGVSFLLAQYKQLGWPLPDLVVPVPSRLWMQPSLAYLLAKRFAALLSLPYQEILVRQKGDFPQEKREREARKMLVASHFSLRKRVELEDKVILLIDDFAVTGATMGCSIQALMQRGTPRAVYALTVARDPDSS